MKKTKLSLKAILLVIVVFGLAVVIGSCKSDGCMDATSLNYDSEAGKDDGSCIYPADKLVGAWSVDETVYSQTNTYDATITKTDNTHIKISAVRNTPPVHFVNDLVLSVNWLTMIIDPMGDTLTGVITNENDFEIIYKYGKVPGAYDVKLHYTR